MAGHGRYPRARLDSMPLSVAARHVSERLKRKGSCRVYIVPTSGIVIREIGDARVPDPVRFTLAGTFDPAAPLSEIARGLAPFMATKACSRSTRTLPLTSFHVDRHGHPRSRCRQCMAAKCAERRVERPVRRYVGDPLNLALRDMPGNRGALLGCGEFTRAYLAEAA